MSSKCQEYYSKCKDIIVGRPNISSKILLELDANAQSKSESVTFLNQAVSSSADHRFIVLRVVDGDTLKLSSGEKVRLIGVDTPETVYPQKPVEYFGKEASAFTKKMCERKSVRLEYDQTKRDKYGRLLAYVYLEDGTFVNAEIIKQGYGHAYTKFSFKYMKEFRAYERDARENKRGLWKD